MPRNAVKANPQATLDECTRRTKMRPLLDVQGPHWNPLRNAVQPGLAVPTMFVHQRARTKDASYWQRTFSTSTKVGSFAGNPQVDHSRSASASTA